MKKDLTDILNEEDDTAEDMEESQEKGDGSEHEGMGESENEAGDAINLDDLTQLDEEDPAEDAAEGKTQQPGGSTGGGESQ